MLKGKLKDEFKKWYYREKNNQFNKIIDTVGCGYDGCEYQIEANDYFEELPFEMQKGVYEAFFDSREIIIEVKPFETKDDWIYQILGKDCMSPFFIMAESNPDKPYKSRQEAFKEAINKLNEILG